VKKSLFIAGISTLAVVVAAALRKEASVESAAAEALRRQETSVTAESGKVASELKALQEEITRKAAAAPISDQTNLDPEIAAWLLKGNYASISESLAPKVLAAAGYPWANPTNYEEDSSNYVLVTKETLRQITVSWNDRGSNMLGDWVCGLLAITPDERQQIDSASDRTRNSFTEWAKANLQREGPSDDQIVRYTIPASPELARSLTNDLYGSFCNIIGVERSQLLWAYEDFWFEMRLGKFGSVSNNLIIYKMPDNPRSSIWYQYWPPGHGGPVPQEDLSGLFASLFPGGWREIAQREGFELPKVAEK
jgi:hypothetical protein